MTKFIKYDKNSSLREFAKRERANLWQSINLALFLPFGLPRSPCGSLAMTDTKKAHFVISQ
mgnify:CR=1 FL=1